MVDIPIGTARSRLHYALRTLRTAIEADDAVLRPRELYEAQERTEEYEDLVARFKSERTEFLRKFEDLADEIVDAVG